MSEFPHKRLAAFQFRQELHDRFFHQDIYTLEKGKRLQHLVLHHCKYLSKLYQALITGESMADLPSTKTTVEMTCTDGIIVALSMMNVCNVDASQAVWDEYQRSGLTPRQACEQLISLVGSMAKVIEDIDHLQTENPLSELGRLAAQVCCAYLMMRTRDSESLNELFIDIRDRLIYVERRSIFSEMHWHEMKALYPALEF